MDRGPSVVLMMSETAYKQLCFISAYSNLRQAQGRF